MDDQPKNIEEWVWPPDVEKLIDDLREYAKLDDEGLRTVLIHFEGRWILAMWKLGGASDPSDGLFLGSRIASRVYDITDELKKAVEAHDAKEILRWVLEFRQLNHLTLADFYRGHTEQAVWKMMHQVIGEIREEYGLPAA